MFNHIAINGRMSKDPEQKTNIFVGGIAFDVGYGDKKKVNFIDFIAFGKTGEFILNKFNKGDGVILEGSLQIDSYKPQGADKPIKTPKIVVRSAHFVVGGKKSSGEQAGQPVPESGDDDIPF